MQAQARASTPGQCHGGKAGLCGIPAPAREWRRWRGHVRNRVGWRGGV